MLVWLRSAGIIFRQQNEQISFNLLLVDLLEIRTKDATTCISHWQLNDTFVHVSVEVRLRLRLGRRHRSKEISSSNLNWRKLTKGKFRQVEIIIIVTRDCTNFHFIFILLKRSEATVSVKHNNSHKKLLLEKRSTCSNRIRGPGHVVLYRTTY